MAATTVSSSVPPSLSIYPDPLPPTWESLFIENKEDIEGTAQVIMNLMKKNEYTKIYPGTSNIFRAFELTKLQDVKVVIIGQDPYPQMCVCGLHPRAQGLSFSVAKCDEIPSSLGNIYKELRRSIPDYKTPNHGDLTKWAEQGVLLLNTCLTVQPSAPDSHKKIWLGFIEKVIKAISDHNKNCVYVMWGKNAQVVEDYLLTGAVKLYSSHPSGFSAMRPLGEYPPFIGSNHFVDINKALVLLGKKQIDWQI